MHTESSSHSGFDKRVVPSVTRNGCSSEIDPASVFEESAAEDDAVLEPSWSSSVQVRTEPFSHSGLDKRCDGI